MRPPRPRAWSALLIATALLVASVVHAEAVYDLVEQGRQALVADKYAESLASLKKAMAHPEFNTSDPGLQFFASYLASFAALALDDTSAAYQYIVSATRFEDADGAAWIHRAGLATAQDAWDDAGKSLTAVATRWPKALVPDAYLTQLVARVVHKLGQENSTRPQRIELLNALFAAGYKAQYETEPGWLWLILATDAIERKDLKRAREVSRHIDDPSTLIAMRIDRRFDALTSADPRNFDVRAAAERNARHLKSVMNKNPKLLDASVQYGYALHALGKFDELLALADGIIARVENAAKDQPPYDDLDENLNWIHNHKATALCALGKWDEGAAVLAGWARNPVNGNDKVSQAINLGFLYNQLGRPADALEAIEGLDTGKDMSEYGRMQYEFVRFQAFTQLGKQAEAAAVVAWMREHQKDSLQTAQGTMLESGDVDGAAALLISRLRDTDERASALAEIQQYAQTPRTDRQKVLDAQREVLLTRSDVAAAIADVGRREKFPIHSIEY